MTTVSDQIDCIIKNAKILDLKITYTKKGNSRITLFFHPCMTSPVSLFAIVLMQSVVKK